MSKIIIGADIVPTESNMYYFEAKEMKRLICPELWEILSSARYRVFNLEVPLIDNSLPIKKCGPNLRASTASINGYKQLHIDFLTLANNHIMDQSEEGLWSTIRVLEEADIAYAGVGYNLEEAYKPHIIEIGTSKLGIYCCAEHEFSIATDTRPGANPFDPLESLDHIANLKAQCDYVICLYHGGKEHYRYPSPGLQKTCRKIVDKGADLVVCQHSHCIGCREAYANGTIVYGQGNFLFDHSKSEYWQTSLLVIFDIDTGDIEYVPLLKDGNGVKLATGREKENILYDFEARSAQIEKDGFVKKEYSSYAHEKLYESVTAMDTMGNTLVFRVLDKMLNYRLRKWLAKRVLKRNRYWMINKYECEAHREFILAGLKAKEE